MTHDITAPAVPHVRPPMVVRGGFVVHRRGNDTSKLATPPNTMIYEHGSLESAVAEARRLAAVYGREFAVFQEIGSAKPFARTEDQPPAGSAESSEAAPPPAPLQPRSVVLERRRTKRRASPVSHQG